PDAAARWRGRDVRIHREVLFAILEDLHQEPLGRVTAEVGDLDGETHDRVAGGDALLRAQVGDGVIVVIVDEALDPGLPRRGCRVDQPDVAASVTDIVDETIQALGADTTAPIAVAEVA